MSKGFHSYTKTQILSEFQTTERGLTTNEANNRLAQNGRNALPKAKKKSAFAKIMAQFKDPMIIVLIIASIASFVISLVEKTNDYVDAIVIVGIVIFNAVIGYLQEQKAEDALENLKKLSQKTTKVLRDGKRVVIPVEEVVIGDKVVFEAGDIIPADLYIIKCYNLQINESSLTGESSAVEKKAEEGLDEKLSLGDRTNLAFSGSVVTHGRGSGIVVATGVNTEIGKIANMLNETEQEQTLLQKNLAQLGKVITIIVLAVAGLIFFLDLLLTSTTFIDAFMTAVAIAVAAIPESLPAVVTIIMAIGVTRMSKKNAIVKHLHSVETLGACEVICTDKTGTLTQNKMTVKAVFMGEQFQTIKAPLTDDQRQLLDCMLFCNDSVVANDQISGDPTETALVSYAHGFEYYRDSSIVTQARVGEIPFDSNRKLMSTIHQINDAQIVFTKGAVDNLLCKCTHILVDGKVQPMSARYKKQIDQAVQTMGEKALRVLAFAEKVEKQVNLNEVESDLTFLGLVGLQDPARPQARTAVKTCLKAGMIPVMITGDHKDTALAIAKELGIATNEKQVMTGAQLDLLTDEEFMKKISKIRVYARVSPQNKVRIVKGWKKLGKVVAMTGDGVNDAPSLKTAHIGIGMGATGTDVTKEVADVILADDNFATIVIAVEEGRKVFANIQKTIQFLFSTNITEVVALVIATILFPNSIFLLPLQILFINLATDILPAIALGFEPIEKDLMTKKPRKLEASVFSDGVGKAIIYQSACQILIAMIVFLIAHIHYSPEVANTMVFLTINIMQLIHMLNVRSHQSIFSSNPFGNKLFFVALFGGLAMTFFIALIPPIAAVFGLVSLSMSQWLIIFVFAFAIIPIVEVVKFVDNHIFKA